MNRKIRLRGFVSLFNCLMFVISLVSGIVLYFVPQGVIANLTNWTFWGLSKHAWSALHINTSLVFFLIMLVHFYYNRRAISGYVYSRFKKALNLKFELALSIILTVLITWASIANVPPFSTIINGHSRIKTYWAEHADLTFNIVSGRGAGFGQRKVTGNHQGRDLGRHTQESAEPTQINEKVEQNKLRQNQVNTDEHVRKGGNWGRKTIEQICRDEGIDLETAIVRLKENGIQAFAHDGIKSIAGRYRIRPGQVAAIVCDRSHDEQAGTE